VPPLPDPLAETVEDRPERAGRLPFARVRRAVGRARRLWSPLLPSRADGEMRRLTGALVKALRATVDAPVDVRELGTALCAQMSARRGGRPVELRFERFPDGVDVTGLWMEFQDFDLVVVEERAEAVQQLVILGHELWHMHAGHCHHQLPDAAAAARALSGDPGLRGSALAVSARNGSHALDEREAEDFGHRLATALRSWVEGGQDGPADPVGKAIQASLGYLRSQG
jgi:hypothetical protein